MRSARRFVSFEGVDGSGKSTQAALFADALEARGQRVTRVREPGGTPVGEALRGLLLEEGPESIAPLAEMHLFAAARAQLVERVVAPAIAGGGWVVADRFVDSSLAYQGVGRAIGVERVLAANRTAVGRHLPCATIVLDLDPAEAERRRRTGPDRIEGEGRRFQERVAQGYRELARRFPIRLRTVDASGAADQVHARVMRAAADALERG